MRGINLCRELDHTRNKVVEVKCLSIAAKVFFSMRGVTNVCWQFLFGFLRVSFENEICIQGFEKIDPNVRFPS